MLSETCNYAESSDKSDDASIISPLLSEEELYVLEYGNGSDDDSMSMEMLEGNCDGIQSHPNVNRIKARYKIGDCIKQRHS